MMEIQEQVYNIAEEWMGEDKNRAVFFMAIEEADKEVTVSGVILGHKGLIVSALADAIKKNNRVGRIPRESNLKALTDVLFRKIVDNANEGERKENEHE